MKVPTAEPITGLDIRLWGILPYVTIAIFVAGTIWRYRYDKFGWTTRSSELYESRLLRIGSPLFHFGLLVVIVGHVIGLLIPKSWTDAVGLSQEAYHLQALLLGAIAGFCTLVGVGILIYRRRTTGPVFMATSAGRVLIDGRDACAGGSPARAGRSAATAIRGSGSRSARSTTPCWGCPACATARWVVAAGKGPGEVTCRSSRSTHWPASSSRPRRRAPAVAPHTPRTAATNTCSARP
jgi:hypothetical protein